MIPDLDVTFDFTRDTPNYWDNFWENNHGLGGGGNDPDSSSKMLQRYHQLLWSKELPNGMQMSLASSNNHNELIWDNFRFGSDSITASFRYQKYRQMLSIIEQSVLDYKSYMENFIRQAYTIGGMVIFPKHWNSINQARGCHPLIKDRWDLTLECIRRYYAKEESPLTTALEQDKAFFDLFIDFEGYIDFFFLQDCLNPDGSVQIWLPNTPFVDDPLPKSGDDYLNWIDLQLAFVRKRNARIAAYWATKSPHS